MRHTSNQGYGTDQAGYNREDSRYRRANDQHHSYRQSYGQDEHRNRDNYGRTGNDRYGRENARNDWRTEDRSRGYDSHYDDYELNSRISRGNERPDDPRYGYGYGEESERSQGRRMNAPYNEYDNHANFRGYDEEDQDRYSDAYARDQEYDNGRGYGRDYRQTGRNGHSRQNQGRAYTNQREDQDFERRRNGAGHQDEWYSQSRDSYREPYRNERSRNSGYRGDHNRHHAEDTAQGYVTRSGRSGYGGRAQRPYESNY